MLPIADIFRSISRQHGGAEVRLPTAAEVRLHARRTALQRWDITTFSGDEHKPASNQSGISPDLRDIASLSRRSSIASDWGPMKVYMATSLSSKSSHR